MIIEEFTKMYHPSKADIDKITLENFVEGFCGKDSVAISNALVRGGIQSISDLYKTDIEDIKRIRTIGSTRMIIVEEMKDYLDSLIS